MKTYIIDTNCFIQAHPASYPLDVAHSFWIKFKLMADEGKIISIDKVKKELFKNDDSLKDWCSKNLPQDFFKEFSSSAMPEYAKLSYWANSHKQYKPSAKAVFLDSERADAFLAAYASLDSSKLVVVTQEVSAPDSKTNIKLPDACNEVHVHCVNLMQMFRELEETF